VPTQGLGFAIPADVVRDSVAKFKAYAEKNPGRKTQPAAEETATTKAERLLGLQLQDLTDDLTNALGYARGRGVLITAVEPDSPADQVGIERGLVLYRVGDRDVNSVQQVERLLDPVRSGATVDLTIGIARANGTQRVETATIAAR
jgi:S1-C subfamily serine protease